MPVGTIVKTLIPVLVLFVNVALADVQVIVDSGVEHQTILGWGATIEEIEIPAALRNQILQEAVDNLGLTRVRLEPPRGNAITNRRWEWLNDNGDPNDIDWTAFNTTELDSHVANWVAPFKQRVEANGDPFNLYVSPSFFNTGSTGAVPAWLFNSPGEYAEYAVSLATYLRDNHSITPDFHAILNEAGNNNPFTADVLGKMIRTLGPRYVTEGLPTKIQFPECVTINTSWSYIQTLQNDPIVWPYIGLLSYHLYGGSGAWGSRTNIRDFGIANGIPTAQTEFGGTTINHIYDDLILGGVSYWEHYVLAFYGSSTNPGDYFAANYNMTSFTRYPKFWDFRQIMHYARPGAVRVDVSSDDSALRPLAFVRNGKMSLVLLNNSTPYQARTVNISGIPAGIYGTCQSIASGVYQELGQQTVGAPGTLTVNVPSNSVLTVYAHPGTNQPPNFTDWRANPSYLTQPASSTTLSVSATDPELDTMGYSWSVISQPAGAAANITSPNSSSTTVTGLTVAGEYVFGINVNDPTNVVQREVRLMVHAGNQPPMIIGVHNRIPVLVTLPDNSTDLRANGIDLEGDSLSYHWSIISKPPGSSAYLNTPNSNQCRVYNMTVAGDHVFKIEISDPTHTVSATLTVPVYPLNTPPVISSVSAAPSQLVQPASNTLLSATTSDPDGDTITHWWTLSSSPESASPVFANQGSAITDVDGLTVRGTYVFTVTVIDETELTTDDVNVTVTYQKGDFDYDNDVDQEDFGAFQACYSGSGTSYDTGCGDADYDTDNDVDLDDFIIFQSCVSGPNIPPACPL